MLQMQLLYSPLLPKESEKLSTTAGKTGLVSVIVVCWLSLSSLLCCALSVTSDQHYNQQLCTLPSCDATACVNELNCSLAGTVKDTCNCCDTCLRDVGEVCGGENGALGSCQKELHCWVLPLTPGTFMSTHGTGVCIDLWNDNCSEVNVTFGCNLFQGLGCQCSEVHGCSNVTLFQYSNLHACEKDWATLKALDEPCLRANCDVVFNPECPADSELVTTSLQPSECCQKPGICKCFVSKCPKVLRPCPMGQQLLLAHRGIPSKPGQCCDKYECLPEAKGCADAICTEEHLECPADSYKLPAVIPKGLCCPMKTQCQCLPDICEPVACEKGQQIKLVKKGDGSPGSCCDQFQCINGTGEPEMYCISEGLRYLNKETWQPEKCKFCECNLGLVFCRNHHCPVPPSDCSRVIFPEGECCAVCAGCTTELGETFNHTDEWHPDDCTFCRCESGKFTCQSQYCSVECEKPRKVPGRCCPVCDSPAVITAPPACPGLEFCILQCSRGLARDDYGCFICACESNKVSGNISTLLPLKQCPLLDSCTAKCAYGNEIDSATGCVLCKCIECASMHFCHKHCIYGFQINDYGCPICKCKRSPKQIDNNNSYAAITENRHNIMCNTAEGLRADSEWWYDGCRFCYCKHGTALCSLLDCPRLSCEKYRYVKGQCCPVCTDTTPVETYIIASSSRLFCREPASGLHFIEGETWDLNVCTKCTCHIGQVLCQELQHCSSSENCTDCGNNSIATSMMLAGNETAPSSSLLHEPMPPPPNNSYLCISEHRGTVHFEPESWREDTCRTCHCRNGSINCFTESCSAQPVCAGKPMYIKDRCCPICAEFPVQKLCYFRALTFSPGEVWKSDNCTNCTCTDKGETVCTKHRCAAGCEQQIPGHVNNECCPTCQGSPDVRWVVFGGNTDQPPVSAEDELLNYSNRQMRTVLAVVCFFLVAACLAIAGVAWLHSRRRRKSYLYGSGTTTSTTGSCSASHNIDAEQIRSLLPLNENGCSIDAVKQQDQQRQDFLVHKDSV